MTKIKKSWGVVSTLLALVVLISISRSRHSSSPKYLNEFTEIGRSLTNNPAALDQMWAQAQGKVQAENHAATQQNAYWAAYQAQAQAGVKQLLTPAPTPQRQEHINYRVNPYTGDIQGSDGTTMSRMPDGSISVTTGGVKTSSSYLQ